MIKIIIDEIFTLTKSNVPTKYRRYLRQVLLKSCNRKVNGQGHFSHNTQLMRAQIINRLLNRSFLIVFNGYYSIFYPTGRNRLKNGRNRIQSYVITNCTIARLGRLMGKASVGSQVSNTFG